MKRSDVTGQRLIAIFLLGWVLLNYPVLSLFAIPEHVAGVPLLFAYVFVAWAALIGLMVLVIERTRD